MRLYDTARSEIVDFDPGPIVTMYTCGITPYDAAHLGHAMVYVTYDVLQRRLRDLGHRTDCVRNVTDVDDDILRKARELGVHYLDLAAGEIARFDADMRALNLLPAASEPRATSAIPDILGFIGMVLDAGHAYRAGGAVYFDVSSFPRFGQVSHYDRDKMLSLAAERGGKPDDPFKHDPLDFVLWQPSAEDEPSWDSLWGKGRPGWHIECSALALRELGTTIDLHGGGDDLVFPHHECESAQKQPPGRPLSGTGCTSGWCASAARRCRSRSATSYSCTRSSRATTPPPSALPCSLTTTGSRGTSTALSSRTLPTASSVGAGPAKARALSRP
jgi:L-cysteine:1D-myo-inositol 2-amino-2-deoxy-alpha-D-glucopyranoside ligase